MTVLLKSLKSAKYVEHPSGWTDEPAKARQFGGAMDALFYCCKHQLSNVEIQGKDFRIPLTEIGWGGSDKLAE